MTILSDFPAPRINPAELRFLRQAVTATATGCRFQAMQAIVVYAKLHDGIDLTDEAAYLEAEFRAAESAAVAPHLSAASY